MRKLEFDDKDLRVRTSRNSVARIIGKVFKYLFLSVLLAVLYYAVFAMVHDTRRERKLKAENQYISEAFESMQNRMDLLDGVIENLRSEDRSIYHDVFNSALPDYVLERVHKQEIDYSRIYAMSESELVALASEKVAGCEAMAEEVTSNLQVTADELALGTTSPCGIPSIVPLRNFTIGQTGASTGNKYNPFYKTLRFHEGIDLLAPVGTEVLAPADGTVQEAKRGKRGVGNVVVLAHPGGVKTVYKHLGEIMVQNGQKVRRGMVIARVGSSGRSFAPHLHYEVFKDGVCQEPVHYFFADLNCVGYRETLLLALTTGQSLD